MTICDLCSNPIVDNKYFSLYLHSPEDKAPEPEEFENNQQYYTAYALYLDIMEKKTKVICPTCRDMLDRIFFYRLEGMFKLTEDIETWFNLPPKIKKGKDEKKKR